MAIRVKTLDNTVYRCADIVGLGGDQQVRYASVPAWPCCLEVFFADQVASFDDLCPGFSADVVAQDQ